MSSEDCKKFSFIWNIENFSHFYHENGQKFVSPVFVAENAGGSRWSVEIYPKGFNQENGEFISCYLKRNDDNLFRDFSEEIVIDFSLDAIGRNGETLGSFKEKNKIFIKGDSVGCLQLVKIEDVKDKIQSWNEDVLTIHCSLTSYKPIATEYIARSSIPIDFVSFDWKVDYYSQNRHFYVNQRKFQIAVIFNNSDICIRITELEQNSGPYQVTCDITLLDINGAAKLQKRNVHLIQRRSRNDLEAWEFLFLTKEQLNDPKYVINSRFVLACKFYIPSQTSFDEIVKCKSNSSSSLAPLQKDLRTLLLDGKHADVKLRTNDQVISAHRSLLSTRSPVFSAMFDQEMIESKTGIIDVPDVDPETLKIFLEFLYTGTMKEFEYDNALKLLIIADKYEVSSLTELCSSYLVSQLTVANVCEVISVADMINHKWLKTSSVDYLARHAAEVMDSSDWNEWMEKNQKLSAEIISNIVANFSIIPKKAAEK